MSIRRVALAWSGGKDSSLALASRRADPEMEVVALVTTVTRDFDRISIHGVRRSVLEAQVAAIDLPLVEATIPAAASNPIYEEAFATALAEVRRRWPDVRHLAFGDLFLTDVRAYREALLGPLGWDPVFPLWGRDTAALARDFVAAGSYATAASNIATSPLWELMSPPPEAGAAVLDAISIASSLRGGAEAVRQAGDSRGPVADTEGR